MKVILEIVGFVALITGLSVLIAIPVAMHIYPVPVETFTATVNYSSINLEPVVIEGVASHSTSYQKLRLYGADGSVLFVSRTYTDVRFHSRLLDGISVDDD